MLSKSANESLILKNPLKISSIVLDSISRVQRGVLNKLRRGPTFQLRTSSHSSPPDIHFERRVNNIKLLLMVLRCCLHPEGGGWSSWVGAGGGEASPRPTADQVLASYRLNLFARPNSWAWEDVPGLTNEVRYQLFLMVMKDHQDCWAACTQAAFCHNYLSGAFGVFFLSLALSDERSGV